jgi:alkylated DNA nucleotide flippase Atl1
MNFDMEAFRQNVFEMVAAIPQGNVPAYNALVRLVGRLLHSRRASKASAQANYSSVLPTTKAI